jgi:TRAP-type uncharacterized transport system substrate-binding protein
LTTGTQLSEDAGYVIAKTLYEHADKVKKGHGMLRRYGRDKMVKANVTIPYHDGAIKYYKEIGLWSEKMDKIQAGLLSEATK